MTEAQGSAVIQRLNDLYARVDAAVPGAGELQLLYWWLMVLTLAVLVLVFFEGVKVYRDW